jgi:hypothetical protein
MNFDNLIALAASVVIGAAAIGRLDALQMWIWSAQARVAYESRSSSWGSPRFFYGSSTKHKGLCNQLSMNHRPTISSTEFKGGALCNKK